MENSLNETQVTGLSPELNAMTTSVTEADGCSNQAPGPSPELNANSAKLVGKAIVALRAYIKALEMQSGQKDSENRYRYLIADDRLSARIVDTQTGGYPVIVERELPPPAEAMVKAPDYNDYSMCDVLVDKSLDEWVRSGRQIRLAFIGLRDAKDRLQRESRENGQPVYVWSTLDAISGEAYLSVEGNRLTDQPDTIEAWAKLGREVEKPLFEDLRAAQEYQSVEAEREVRAKMVRLGIIREPRTRAN